MRRILYGVLCVVLYLMLGVGTAYAEAGQVDMSKWITIKVDRHTMLYLWFESSSEDVWVKVTGVEEEGVVKVTKGEPVDFYCIGSSTTEIKVYGAIERLQCNESHITELDISHNKELRKLVCGDNLLSTLDVSRNNKLHTLKCQSNRLSELVVSQNSVLSELRIYSNNFSTSSLNDLFCQLPVASTIGAIFVVKYNGDPIETLLARSTSKEILSAKRWSLVYESDFSDIEHITGNYRCGDSYSLTLESPTLPNTFVKNGGEWNVTVKSTGAWKIDETTLPDWLTVVPNEGENNANVSIKSKPNVNVIGKQGAVTFVLSEDENTKQVVVLGQYASRPLLILPVNGYNFPITGEKKQDFFTVESLGDWVVEVPENSWCKIEPQMGAQGITKVSIEAKENNGITRSEKLIFKHKDNGSISQAVEIKQLGGAIQVTPAEGYTFPIEGGKKQDFFTVESTDDWIVDTPNDFWCKVEPKAGKAGRTNLTITADVNLGNERSAEITFSLLKNPKIKQVVVFKQNWQPSTVESAAFAGIIITPNPFSTQLRIKNEALREGRYELFTPQGVVVHSGMLQGAEDVINTENLSAGIYLLRILVGDDSKTQQVLKE